MQTWSDWAGAGGARQRPGRRAQTDPISSPSPPAAQPAGWREDQGPSLSPPPRPQGSPARGPGPAPVLPLLPPGASPPSPSWGPPPAPTQQAAGRHQHEGAGSRTPPWLWGGPGKPSSPGAAEVRGPWPQEPRALESRHGRDHRAFSPPQHHVFPSGSAAWRSRPGGGEVGTGIQGLSGRPRTSGFRMPAPSPGSGAGGPGMC